jgi:hypothetical protein
MRVPDHNNSESSEPRIPKRLQDDLGRLYQADVSVPDEIDDRILALARTRLSRKEPLRKRPLPVRVLRWALPAAAAALLLIFAGIQLSHHFAAQSGSTGVLANANGRVTILDAFALARSLEIGTKPDLRWDVNGDGKVDERDVKTLAQAAVSLTPGAIQ